MKQVSKVLFALVFGLALGCLVSATAAGQGRKPNILVIMDDDIGQASISVFTKGLMGYRTPSIDRTAKEGMLFTDYYAEQSCTAGRSSFLTGQEAKSPRREFLYFSDDCDLDGREDHEMAQSSCTCRSRRAGRSLDNLCGRSTTLVE